LGICILMILVIKMTTPPSEYLKNMSYFLKHSNEEEIDSNTFLKEYLEKTNTKNLHWLDVGAGPGTKLVRIIKNGLTDYMDYILIDVVEPSKELLNVFNKNFCKNKLEYLVNERHHTIWEEFVAQKQYDLITFFHSMYRIEKNSLEKIPSFLKKNGLACIIIESPNSDLFPIRQKISPYYKHKDIISYNVIIDYLKEKNISHEVSTQEPDQRFYVDGILDPKNSDTKRVLSFILQTKPEDHEKIVKKEINREINKELKKHVKKDKHGKSYIHTPDRFIWIYK